MMTEIQKLRGINDRLSDFLQSYSGQGGGCPDGGTLSHIQSILTSAGDCTEILKQAQEYDPQAEAVLSDYRLHLLELSKVLMSIEARLQSERSTLHSSRARLQAVEDWVQAQNQISLK